MSFSPVIASQRGCDAPDPQPPRGGNPWITLAFGQGRSARGVGERARDLPAGTPQPTLCPSNPGSRTHMPTAEPPRTKTNVNETSVRLCFLEPLPAIMPEQGETRAEGGQGPAREDRNPTSSSNVASCVPYFDALWFCYCELGGRGGGRPCLPLVSAPHWCRCWGRARRSGARRSLAAAPITTPVPCLPRSSRVPNERVLRGGKRG